VARATRTGWVEEICRLCVEWRSSEKSIRQLFAPALPHIDDRAAFLAAVSGWLRAHPDLIDAWQGYCEDKRTGQSPYFYFDGAWKVGFYDSSVKDVAGRYQDEHLYADGADACADFIYREAMWVLGRAGAR
jgi:hypothetical protein